MDDIFLGVQGLLTVLPELASASVSLFGNNFPEATPIMGISSFNPTLGALTLPAYEQLSLTAWQEAAAILAILMQSKCH